MDTALTIHEFSKLITSERKEEAWLEALRKLTRIERPEDVTAATTAYALAAWWWGR